jgi:hypothetical protein
MLMVYAYPGEIVLPFQTNVPKKYSKKKMKEQVTGTTWVFKCSSFLLPSSSDDTPRQQLSKK